MRSESSELLLISLCANREEEKNRRGALKWLTYRRRDLMPRPNARTIIPLWV